MFLQRSLLFGMREHVIGGAVAGFFLVGRWSFARLGSESTTPTFLTEPRFWLVAVMVLALFLPASRLRGGAGVPRLQLPGGLSALIFFVWIGCSAFWALDGVMAQTKLYEIILVYVAMLSLRTAWQTSDPAKIAHAIWLYLVIVGSALALVGLTSLGDERLAVLGGGPNTFGRNMGVLCFGAWYAMDQDRRPFVWIPLIAIAGFLVVLSGSRGAMLSLGIAMLFFLVAQKANLARRLGLLGALGVVALVIYTSGSIGQRTGEMFESRVTVTTLLERHSSGRDQIFAASFETGMEHPYAGIGLNGFQARHGDYPHNIFLETFSETGFTGLVLFFIMLISFAGPALKQWKRIDKPSAAAALLLLTSAQFSGDLFDSRGIFLMILLPFHQSGKYS